MTDISKNQSGWWALARAAGGAGAAAFVLALLVVIAWKLLGLFNALEAHVGAESAFGLVVAGCPSLWVRQSGWF